MLIYLLRHGLTQDNQEKRYQGRRDVPLCPQGLAQLRRADFAPKTVMITSLQRTRQTAEVLFPDAELVVADGLKEMDFGVFEGRNYREMEYDPQYRAWVETGCEGTALEKRLRAQFPQTPQGELCGGAVLAAILPVGTFLITALVCRLAAALHPLAELAVQMFWCAQALAARGLVQESCNVYKELQKQNLPAARKAVARIVGRDTQNLTAEGVTKAAVETVAENASDGVIAPLLYMLLGGAPLALTYKAINTMDSMLGYKNQKYLYFGRAAARLDDVANYLPSRLAGLLWVAAAALTGSSARGAWKIWRRDRRNHASPNSAQTESACAGALGVQLAGPAYYFGEYYDKPTIGDALRPVEPKDILRADRMMYAESLLALVLGIALRLLVLAM